GDRADVPPRRDHGRVHAVRRALITGGGGFIGSNLADRLLAEGVEVVIYDNFSTGRREFVPEAAQLVEADVLDREALALAMNGCDTVFHLQANADVRHGLERPRVDLEQNTFEVAIVFCSCSAGAHARGPRA